ncbi:C40 family peptidase [Nocardiopsis algeriensis]|uniref:Cell wall-associated NlpC family hydrolase n=1 Tax=Nocardiopsis algeriensis TaxID=1478215 RepID=A0A841IPZ0_9ACTN|nr:C40 family peptidase [Nocardiopsis algeriensis]MBB6120909.1 cell wall-associated NlpC family hydrolase [Nocardiopsis algeriensis]
MRPPMHPEQIEARRPARTGRRASLLLAVLLASASAAGAAPASAHPQAARGLPSATVERAIDAAESQKGAPYVWGGSGPGGFDCSGLVQWSFAQAGVDLPRVADAQTRAGTRIGYSSAERGDILYWSDGGSAYHVAIYLGNGRMIDAPHSGEQVRERDVHHGNLGGAVRL